MPKVELPYNEEGMDMAKEIKPKAEAVGGTVDFGGNIPVNNAQERSGEGDVSQYYRIGGGIKFYSGHKGSEAAKNKEKEMSAKREERFKELKEKTKVKKSKKAELKAYKKKVDKSKLYEDSRAGKKQRKIDKLAKKRKLGLGNKKRTQRKINWLSKLRDKPFLTKVDTTPKNVGGKKKVQ